MSEFSFGILSEIAKGKRGVTYKPEDLVLGGEQEHYRLLTAGNIQDGITTTHSYAKVSPRCVSQNQLISPDEILVCMSNGSKRLVGKSSRLRSADSKRYCVGAFCSTFTPNENADPEFVFQIFQSENFKKHVSDALEGSAINNLKNSTIESFEVPIPPLPEQKKIAEILSGIDQLIQGVRAKVDKLKAIRNAFIQNLHENNPLKWVALGEISDFVTSGSRGWSQYYSSKGPRFVRIGNLSRNSIDLDPTPEKWQLVEPPEGVEGARTKLEDGDLLISITADLGICSIYSMSIGEAYINQHIALVRLDGQHRNFARQVAYYICSEHCQEQIRSMNDSGAKAGLNLDSIRRIQVPLIEYGEENNKIQTIDALQSAISGNLALLDHYAHEKSSISADLLSGRKRVSV